jgi:Transposase DDE domain
MTRRWILVVPPTAPHQSSGAGVASHPVQSRSTKGGQPWAPTSRRGDPGWGGGRPPSFRRRPLTGVRRRGLRRRNVVERCFARLEQFRALATRYAKRAAYHRAILIIAAVVLWLREDRQDRP